MPTYNIRGISVDFPYEAYDCQLIYMDKVIQSLKEKSNALLESPTGTGKTLCLLCATLAWRKSLGPFSTGRIVREGYNEGSSQSFISTSQSNGTDLPAIVYTSRTHSQLRQVIQELKRTSYRPKMAILGSREQLCIHEEVSLLRGSSQNNACHFLCKRKSNRFCGHYSKVADFLKKDPCLGDEPIDIEDLVNIGRSHGPCPYYVSRELHKVVDILFAPYSYLIEPKYRKSLSVVWDNSILIFDEAHNLESLCAEAASFDLPSTLLTACIAEAKKCIDISLTRREIEKSNDKSDKPDNYAILRALLLKLEKRISEVRIDSKELGFTEHGPYIYELLDDLNITHETASMLVSIIEEAALLLNEDSITNNGPAKKAKDTTCRLESISTILQTIFRDGGKAHAQYYRVHVREAEKSVPDVLKGKTSRILSWWCFNPGLAMEEFTKLHVGSIILTSGTLSPLDSFAQELQLEFPIRLENPHVISSDQLWSGVVSAGPSGYSFNSSYHSRDTLEYKQELGNAIVNFARIVPDGLLVFFPSYYLLDQAVACWQTSANSLNSSSIWERICKHKQPVVEPRQSSLFPLAIEDYMAKLKDTSTTGAVFFAVCRGKVSEGLDFADHAGRAVVIIGLPFALRNDPKVRLKREYLNKKVQSQLTGCKVLTGEEWYSQQESRAVNQAVGRVIRHRCDYGAIIFCDERFALPNRQSQVSRWIQPYIKSYSKFGDVVFTLTRFFRSGGSRSLTNLKLLPAKDSSSIPTSKPVIDEEKHESQSEHVSYPPKPSNHPHENVNEMKMDHSLDKLHLEQFFTSLAGPRQDRCMSKEIVPANRSTLNPSKRSHTSTLKLSSNLFSYEKKLLVPKVKSVQHQNNEIVDLTSDSISSDNPAKRVLIQPCSLKKPKIEKIENDRTQFYGASHEQLSTVRGAQQSRPFTSKSMKHEKLQISYNNSNKNDRESSAVVVEEEISGRAAESPKKKNKSVVSNPVSDHDEETKGSAFLVQVKEKLTASEYLEFVGFMKALKSKAMKIGQVLQSIVGLFSAPERLPLLARFKDYIPAKYHQLFEQHLKAIDQTIGSGR